MQVKRCDDMARKLRFLKDQVEKAALLTGSRLGVDRDYEFDELEVCDYANMYFSSLDQQHRSVGACHAACSSEPRKTNCAHELCRPDKRTVL